MKSLEEFFNLNTFAHASLWEKDEPIWTPLKKLSDYLNFWPKFQIDIDIPKDVHLVNKEFISIGAGTKIEPGVLIIGPCIIGKNCHISHGAYIRERVILGDECHVGHSAEIKHSIVLDGTSVTHFVYVGDSIIGNSVNLGAGVKCANLRLDRQNVWVKFKGEKIDSGLKKFGAIVGDQVQIGCNSVINPGTLIGKECFSYPLTLISGYIPPSHQISLDGVSLKRALC